MGKRLHDSLVEGRFSITSYCYYGSEETTVLSVTVQTSIHFKMKKITSSRMEASPPSPC